MKRQITIFIWNFLLPEKMNLSLLIVFTSFITLYTANTSFDNFFSGTKIIHQFSDNPVSITNSNRIMILIFYLFFFSWELAIKYIISGNIAVSHESLLSLKSSSDLFVPPLVLPFSFFPLTGFSLYFLLPFQ